MIRQGFRMYSRRVIKIFATILENSLFRILAESVNLRLSVFTLGLVEGVLPAKRVCVPDRLAQAPKRCAQSAASRSVKS